MKIQIASKNEYIYYPNIETDMGNNRSIEKSKRFGIVVRKVNSPAYAQEYMNIDLTTGGVNLDSFNKLRLNVVRLINSPTIDFVGDQAKDEKGNDIPSKEMTVDDLFDTRFPEFFPVLQDLQLFVGKLETEGLETKKS